MVRREIQPREAEKEAVLVELEGIVNRENVDSSMTFRLEEERDESGQEIEGQAFWLSLECEGGEAEGKLYIPEGGKKEKLVMFEPGMPGGSTASMEEEHVSGLLDEGHTVLVLRHLGTRVKVDGEDDFIHCPERTGRGKDLGGELIGSREEYSVEEASHEVGVAANALGGQFEEISIVAHSSGVLNTLYDFKNMDPIVQEKVRRIVALAGFVGIDTFKPGFDLEAFYENCNQQLSLGSGRDNVAAAEKMLADISDRGVNLLPEDTMMIQVMSPQDEHMDSSGIERLQEAVLGRGLHVVDETQFEADFHDLKNLRTETLLRFLKMHYPRTKHTITVREREPRG